MRSKGRASLTALVRVVRTEAAPTMMVTTRVTPMMIAVPVAEVRPGLRIVFSRAMADRVPGKAEPKARVRAGSSTEATSSAPRSARSDPPKAPRNFVPPLSERHARATEAHPATAMSAPMTKRTVCFLRAAAPASFTGARAATGATREAARAGKTPTRVVNRVAPSHVSASCQGEAPASAATTLEARPVPASASAPISHPSTTPIADEIAPIARASRVTSERTCRLVAPSVRSSASSRVRCVSTTRKVEETTIEATSAAIAGKISMIPIVMDAPRRAWARSSWIAWCTLVTLTPETPLNAELAVATHSSWVALGGFALLSASAALVATMNFPEAVVPKIAEKPPSVT